MKTIVKLVPALALMAAPLAAQDEPDGDRRPPAVVFVGGGLEVAATVGEFSNYVEGGIGAGGTFTWRPGEGPLGLRLNALFSQYGSTTNRYNLVGLINVDVTTRNQIAGFTVGPQVYLGRGAIQLYGHAGIGFSYFFTRSSVEGSDQNNQPFASTTNQDDITFAGEYGGGMLVRLARTPVYLDLGGRMVRNGSASYVTENSINFNVSPPVVGVLNTEANFWVIRLGIVVGLRDDSRGPRRGGSLK